MTFKHTNIAIVAHVAFHALAVVGVTVAVTCTSILARKCQALVDVCEMIVYRNKNTLISS